MLIHTTSYVSYGLQAIRIIIRIFTYFGRILNGHLIGSQVRIGQNVDRLKADHSFNKLRDGQSVEKVECIRASG